MALKDLIDSREQNKLTIAIYIHTIPENLSFYPKHLNHKKVIKRKKLYSLNNLHISILYKLFSSIHLFLDKS